MIRFMVRLLLLAGLVLWLGSTSEIIAQSKKKLGGPVVEIEGMKAQVYEHWKAQKAEKPNLYKFLLPIELKSDTDATVLTIYPVSASKADEVVEGWKKQFTPPKGFKIDEIAIISKFKVGKADITSLYIQGDYQAEGSPTKLEKQRLQGYVFQVGDKRVAIQALGGFKSVGFNKGDLDAWVKNFK